MTLWSTPLVENTLLKVGAQTVIDYGNRSRTGALANLIDYWMDNEPQLSPLGNVEKEEPLTSSVVVVAGFPACDSLYDSLWKIPFNGGKVSEIFILCANSFSLYDGIVCASH